MIKDAQKDNSMWVTGYTSNSSRIASNQLQLGNSINWRPNFMDHFKCRLASAPSRTALLSYLPPRFILSSMCLCSRSTLELMYPPIPLFQNRFHRLLTVATRANLGSWHVQKEELSGNKMADQVVRYFSRGCHMGGS
ncbi:hypothetical protein ACFX1S_013616 [Malus domestica]